jgi:16S rRNA C967 or C1407 C5-methylase (RsmB/RsmF family)
MEFQRGLFEIQDEGSQLAGLQVKCQPGEKVLDFCAGSGGKTLTFGPFLQGKGQIYLYDHREKALAKARKRLNRAGLQNIQFDNNYELLKAKLAGKMDWVVLDVPCTGRLLFRFLNNK